MTESRRSTATGPGPSLRLEHEPYEHLTAVDIDPARDRTNVVMTLDPLHDERWTEYRAHRSNELDELEAAIRRRRPS
jgi:hypothetical protein